MRRAIKPLGESLTDGEIVLRLAEKMGASMPYSSPLQVMEELDELLPLREGLGDVESETRRGSYGSQLLKGFARFCPVEYVSQVGASGDYPFTLLTGVTLYHLGAGSRTSRAPRLKRFSSEAFLEIGESDAAKLGINHGDGVRVISPVAELTTAVKVTDTLPEGTVFMPISFPEHPVTSLFSIALEPEAKTPALKACNVKIERTGPHG